jgi:AcrR family transcriptional regulator
MKTSSPPRYHHGDLRRTLLDLAMQSPDPEHLSLRELAAGAGVSAAAVYRHFENRDALMHTLAQVGFGMLRESFAEGFDLQTAPCDATDAIQRMLHLGAAYVRFADTHTALWRLMFGSQAASFRDAVKEGPTSHDYLHVALSGLHQHRLIQRSPSADDLLFAWSTMHGATALRVGRVTAASGDTTNLVDGLVKRVIAGLSGSQ